MAQSKTVLGLERKANATVASLETNAARAGERVGQRLDQFRLAGEPSVAWDQVLRQLARAGRQSILTLLEVDSAAEEERLDDAPVQQERNEAAAEAYTEAVSTRAKVATVYGDGAVRALGFSGDTPRDPLALKNLGTQLVERLPRLAALAPADPDLVLDPQRLADRLAPMVERLALALEAVDRERRENEPTISARLTHLDEHARLARGLNLVGEGLLRLAGMAHEADRLRTNLPRAAGGPPDEEEPAAAPSVAV